LEYLLGSLVTLACVFVINRIARQSLEQSDINFEISQSYLVKILAEYNDKMMEDKLPETQSYKHVKNQYVRILIVEDKAYWIRDNQLYMAKFQDGVVDSDSTAEVDTMAMSAVELEQTMFIVEKLSEDN
jgi:hypothetical protein